MKEIDVRGLSCPEPVLILKSEVEKSTDKSYKVLANEAHTVKNIKLYAESVGKKVTVKEVGDEYELTVE